MDHMKHTSYSCTTYDSAFVRLSTGTELITIWNFYYATKRFIPILFPLPMGPKNVNNYHKDLKLNNSMINLKYLLYHAYCY